jgi:pimeloyl-ACP methyl ester carboxylesterase
MLVAADVRRAIMGWPSHPDATIAGLKKVRVPTLITHGRKDTVVLPRAAERTAETIVGSRISWFDRSGHSPFCEEPERFNRELAQFVRSCQKT